MPEDLVGGEIVHEAQAGSRVVDGRGVVALQLLVHELGGHVHRVAQSVLGGRALRARQQPLARGVGEQLLDGEIGSPTARADESRPSFSSPRSSSRFRSSGRSLATTSCSSSTLGDQRLASRIDVVSGNRRHPALTVGVVQRAVDQEESGQPLAQLVEPDVAQRLGVVFGRARVLHLRRHPADRHAAGEQRQQRVAHRVVAHRRLGHHDGVRIGNDHRRIVAEHLLAAADVIPSARRWVR